MGHNQRDLVLGALLNPAIERRHTYKRTFAETRFVSYPLLAADWQRPPPGRREPDEGHGGSVAQCGCSEYVGQHCAATIIIPGARLPAFLITVQRPNREPISITILMLFSITILMPLSLMAPTATPSPLAGSIRRS
jgi:hypothetical protein